MMEAYSGITSVGSFISTQVMTDYRKFVAVEVEWQEARGLCMDVATGFALCNLAEGDVFDYNTGHTLAYMRALDLLIKQIHNRLPEDVRVCSPLY